MFHYQSRASAIAAYLMVVWAPTIDAAAQEQATDDHRASNNASACSDDVQESPAPFQLTNAEQQEVDALLKAWEDRSGPIRSLRCRFTRWQYLEVAGLTRPLIGEGTLTYDWPNRASYRLLSPTQERWERNADAIYEFDYRQKIMFRHALADQGTEMASWPLPLLYRVRAADVKRDYWVRINPAEQRDGSVLLELFPRQQPSQQNFWAALNGYWTHIASGQHLFRYQRLDVLLSKESLVPIALRIHDHGGSQTSYAFSDLQVATEPPGLVLSDMIHRIGPFLPDGWTKQDR